MAKIRITCLPKSKYGGGDYKKNFISPILAKGNNLSALGNKFAESKIAVNNTLPPADKDKANLEAEKSEVVVTDLTNSGLPELYVVGGTKHYEKGTPLNLPADSFVFSQAKSMKITDPEILRLFNMGAKKSGYTFADIAKKYKINDYRKILADKNTDQMQRDTAESMIANYNDKLAKLALAQEIVEGFPQGIPSIGMPYIQTSGYKAAHLFGKQEQEETPDTGQAKYGGTNTVPEMFPALYQYGGGTKKIRIKGLPKAAEGLETDADPGEVSLPIESEINNKYETLRAKAEADLKAAYRDKNIKVIVKGSKRSLAEQEKAYNSGASTTKFGLHGLGAARDFNIIVDGRVLGNTAKDHEIYQKYLWKNAEDMGLFHLNKSEFGKVDPYHIGLVKETGTGQAFKDLIEKYPEIQNTKQFQDSLAEVQKFKAANPKDKTYDNFIKAVTPEFIEQTRKLVDKTPVVSIEGLEGVKSTGNPTMDIMIKEGYRSGKMVEDWKKKHPGEIKDAKLEQFLKDEQASYERAKRYVESKGLSITPEQEKVTDSGVAGVKKTADVQQQAVNDENQRSYEEALAKGDADAAKKAADALKAGQKKAGAVPEGTLNTKPPYTAPAKFWSQDILKSLGAFGDLTRIKKYLPWQATYNPYLPTPTFTDPTRELATSAEQANIASQAAGMFAGPQGLNARLSQIQGQGAENAANILGKYNNINVGIANQAAQNKAAIMNQYGQSKAQQATQLYDKTTIANQQFDNAKAMARQNLRQSFMDAITNRGTTQALNTMYPQYQVDPSTGMTHFTGEGKAFNPAQKQQQLSDLASQYMERHQGQGIKFEDAMKMAMMDLGHNPYAEKNVGAYPGEH